MSLLLLHIFIVLGTTSVPKLINCRRHGQKFDSEVTGHEVAVEVNDDDDDDEFESKEKILISEREADKRNDVVKQKITV
uniref:Uncharacterized protein n=1 Tax=Caenorhabditis tropicalis TaxID=1561998 RepID=A0A1I7UC88_9PELO